MKTYDLSTWSRVVTDMNIKVPYISTNTDQWTSERMEEVLREVAICQTVIVIALVSAMLIQFPSLKQGACQCNGGR